MKRKIKIFLKLHKNQLLIGLLLFVIASITIIVIHNKSYSYVDDVKPKEKYPSSMINNSNVNQNLNIKPKFEVQDCGFNYELLYTSKDNYDLDILVYDATIIAYPIYTDEYNKDIRSMVKINNTSIEKIDDKTFKVSGYYKDDKCYKSVKYDENRSYTSIKYNEFRGNMINNEILSEEPDEYIVVN